MSHLCSLTCEAQSKTDYFAKEKRIEKKIASFVLITLSFSVNVLILKKKTFQCQISPEWSPRTHPAVSPSLHHPQSLETLDEVEFKPRTPLSCTLPST